MGHPDTPPQPTTMCTYVCGEGDYEATAPWPAHQQHYEDHQKEK